MTGKEIGAAVSLVMLETSEHHIGSLPAAYQPLHQRKCKKYWGIKKKKKNWFGYNERRIKSESSDHPVTGRDGFACLRILQNNMINGKCGFNVWRVFTHKIDLMERICESRAAGF